MGDLNALLQSNLVLVGGGLVALGILVLLLILVVIVQARRISRLSRRLDAITRGDDGQSLHGILESHLDRVSEVSRGLDELEARMALLEGQGRRALQGLGMVRYNAFEETGGNQSFALAVLDADDDGFVVSGLHARSGTRVYAKTLTRGRPEVTLSDEELRAVANARAAAGDPRSRDVSATAARPPNGDRR